MRPLADAPRSALQTVRLVLTDMNDTLTLDGRLAAGIYTALERLEAAGVRVVPVTAAPAGWCDQMVRMWPIAVVIGENGGFCFLRDGTAVTRHFWRDAEARFADSRRLAEIAGAVLTQNPSLKLSDDQPLRLTSLAVARPDDGAAARSIVRAFEDAGASATLNASWAVAWFGGYDKITAARKFLPLATGFDVDQDRDSIVFVADSSCNLGDTRTGWRGLCRRRGCHPERPPRACCALGRTAHRHPLNDKHGAAWRSIISTSRSTSARHGQQAA